MPSLARAPAMRPSSRGWWLMLNPSVPAPRRARFSVFWHTTRTGVGIIRNACEPSCALVSSTYGWMRSSGPARYSWGMRAIIHTRRPPWRLPAVSYRASRSPTRASMKSNASRFWNTR